MPINDGLAKQALDKIRQLELENHELRKQLGLSDLESGIQKSLQHPATGNGRNRVVSDIVRPALFLNPGQPVSKSARLQAEAERKKQLRREREKAIGLRPKDD